MDTPQFPTPMAPEEAARAHAAATPIAPPPVPGGGFDYRHFYHYLIERLWIIVLCLLVSTFWGLNHLYRTHKLYQSRLVLEVDSQMKNYAGSTVQTVDQVNMQSLEQLRTIEQNLRNRSLMERVARAGDLGHNRDFLPAREDGATYSEESLANALLGMVSPVIRRGTRLIDVFVVHTDPKMAQTLADSVGAEYIRQSIEKRAGGTRMAYDYLREQGESLKKKLQESENKLQDYRKQTGSVSLDDKENIVDSKLKDLSARATQVKADRLRLQGDMQQINNYGANVDKLLTVASIANHPTVTEAKAQISNMTVAIANLAQRYKDEHPRMIQAHSQLAELNKNLRDAVLRLPPLLRSEYDNSGTIEKNLQNALDDQQKAALELNQQSIPFKELQREVDADKAMYESVLKRINETDLIGGIQADPVQVAEPATYSPVAISPQPVKEMTAAILSGLAIGVGIVLLMNLLDRSIKTVDQAEHFLNLPVFAAVPDTKFSAQRSYLLMVREPNSTAAEAFRSLRASLALLGPEAERKLLIFTSAVPSEGKSFSCTNYSVSLAQQGNRTLLIDGDLRRPSLHKIFGFESEIAGVTDCLVGRAELQAVVQPTLVENLYVLAGGQKAPNPAELLSGHSFAELMLEAARTFDRVVIDSAPLIAVSDTLLMTPYIQSICLVVRADKTPRNVVQRAIGMLDQSGRRPVGLVLNRLPKQSGSGYYYYYSEHGYGGNVYGGPISSAAAVKGSDVPV